ncbi:hypothetical protein JCM18899A_16280 [Nocardioides sp. AN3]
MLRVDAAESRGDLDEALDLMEEMPDGPDGRPFWRPSRVERLLQLRLLGAAMPSWVHARWLLEQALQPREARLMDVARRALETAVRVRGGHAAVQHAYPVEPDVTLIEHDWVFRQCHLYELGGLTRFLGSGASPALVRRASHVREWAQTPMGGYRLLDRGSARTTFKDLAGGEQLETPNIGSAALVIPGECVIGRLVPITTGRIFESVPLPVPEDLARTVARRPRSWLDLLERATQDAAVSAHVHRFGFVSDLPTDLAATAILDSDDRAPGDVVRALLKTAEDAVADALDWTEEDVDPWACIGSLVQSPAVLHSLALDQSDVDANVFARLSERLAEPAASICRGIATELRHVA